MIAKAQQLIGKFSKKLDWLGPLLARIAVGVVFAKTGWGKLHGLDDVTQFFTELGLPAPHAQAILVGTTEFVGGLLVLFGLGTRFASLPLACTMVVAILTAKRADIDGVSTLLGFDEFLYLVLFLWLALQGAGKASLDYLMGRKLRARSSIADPGALAQTS
jgi:putative oxidoreductase